MNMNSNIKRGTSINGGMVLTDMPIKALVALRDAVNDAIRNSRKADSDRLLTDIISAIDAANDEGYMVNLNGVPLNPNHLSVDYDEDEDYWDDDDDDDDPCDGCEDNCAYCHYH